MKVKVLHLLYKVDIGGTERAVLNYIKEQTDEDIINYTCSIHEGKLSNDYKKYSNNHIDINETNYFKIYKALKKHIDKEKYDIIYTYGLRTNMLFRFMPKKFKLIYGIRGLESNVNNKTDKINKLTLKRNDLIITNSKLSRDHIQKKYNLKKDKVIAVHNGTFLPDKIKKAKYECKINLIIIANLNKVKGFDYLLPAIKELVESNIKINLEILGEGSERLNIETYIKDNDLSKSIQLRGQVQDVYKYLINSHILISSSLSEGLSNSIMEAMAVGLPVIATDVGGTSELVTPNKTGMLIKPKSTHNIVNAIKVYYDNPTLMIENGLNGRRKIKKNFSFTKLVNENNKIFRNLKEN